MIGNGTEPSFIEQDTNSIVGCDKINNDDPKIEIVHTRGKYLLALIKKFEVLSLPDISYIPFTKNKTSQNVKKHDNHSDGYSKQLQTSANEDIYHQDGETVTELLTMNASLKDDCPDMKKDIEPIYIDKLSIALKSDKPVEDLPEDTLSQDRDANPTLSTINTDNQNVRPNRLRIVTFDLSKTDYIYYDKDSESSDECDYLAFPEIADKSNDENSSSTINEIMIDDKELDKLAETNKMNNDIEASLENTDMIVEKLNSLAEASNMDDDIETPPKNTDVMIEKHDNLAENINMDNDAETPPKNTDGMAEEYNNLSENINMDDDAERTPENTDVMAEEHDNLAENINMDDAIETYPENTDVMGEELNSLAENINMDDAIETPLENTDVMGEELNSLAETNTINNEIEASHDSLDMIDNKELDKFVEKSNMGNDIDTPLENIDVIDDNFTEMNSVGSDIISSSKNTDVFSNEMKEIDTLNNRVIANTSTNSEPFININERLDNHNDILMDIDDDTSTDDNMSIDISEATLNNEKYLQLNDEKLEEKHACVIHELIYKFNKLKHDKLHEVKVQTPPKIVHRIDSYGNSVYIMSKNNKDDTRSINEKFIDLLSIGKDEFYQNKKENVDIYVEVDGELHDYDSYVDTHNRSGFFSFISRLFLCGSN